MSLLQRALEFADKANTHGVVDEDGNAMTTQVAVEAIASVCETIALRDGLSLPVNVDHAHVWDEVETLVLDRFGYDPDAFDQGVTS
jgi:hypothetical protein